MEHVVSQRHAQGSMIDYLIVTIIKLNFKRKY